jgi:hypothetical protein
MNNNQDQNNNKKQNIHGQKTLYFLCFCCFNKDSDFESNIEHTIAIILSGKVYRQLHANDTWFTSKKNFIFLKLNTNTRLVIRVQ